MKKSSILILSIIIISVSAIGLAYNMDLFELKDINIFSDPETTLADEKVSAKDTLTLAYDGYLEGDYSAENWTILSNFKTNGDTAIDSALNMADIKALQTLATEGMNGVLTKVRAASVAPSTALFSYKDDFDTLNKNFWWVAKWVTLEDASSSIKIENGIIKLPTNETDRGPFLISKPLAVEIGDIVTIKRKVKFHYANEYFHGNMLINQSEFNDLDPLSNNGTWASVMQDTMTYVSYLHYYYEAETREVTDGILLSAKNETTDKTYSVMDPIFDKWFEETIQYNTGTGEVTYNCNGEELKGIAKTVDKPYIRIVLHSYGWYTGHEMEIDNFEVNITR